MVGIFHPRMTFMDFYMMSKNSSLRRGWLKNYQRGNIPNIHLMNAGVITAIELSMKKKKLTLMEQIGNITNLSPNPSSGWSWNDLPKD